MICPYIIKTALNAQKMRQMAKSVGLIPHPKSQWKWALRQMRKANPKGIKNAPIMQKGKELAKTKEKVGKLSNNIKQKLKALQRKQKLGVEVGMTKGKKGWDTYGVGSVGNIYGVEDAHSHPSGSKYLFKLLASEGSKRHGMISNKTLHASPSGMRDWTKKDYNKYLSRRKRYDRGIKKITQIKSNHPILSIKSKILNLLPRSHPYLNRAERKIQALEAYKSAEKLTAGMGGMDSRLIKQTGRVHNILSQGVEGVHKSNLKLPNAIRSVYFKGGL